MGAHGTEHERILRDVVTESIAREDPRVVELLERCDECRSELHGLERALARVDGASDELRSEMEAVERMGPVSTVDVRARLELVAETEPHASPSSGRWLLAVAAVLLIGFMGFLPQLLRDDDEQSDPLYLGDDEVQLIGPVGAVVDFTAFEWRCERDDVRSYTLRVYDAADETEHIARPYLKETTWTPERAERQALPDRIKWDVEAIGAGGEVVAQSSLVSSSRN